jgi:hypothetical protein
MVNFSRIKENRMGHKGQSLVEVAVFGAFLLMVLGFLLNAGMSYNYQQEVKMEAYRRAMQMAAQSSTPKGQVVQVVKDVHFPDPSDMFALGSREAIQSAGSVFWSNNSSQLDYATPENSTTKRFVFNPDSPPATRVSILNRTYTTAALDPQHASIIPNKNAILNGVPVPYVVNDMSQTKVYQAEKDVGTKEVMILMNTSIDCEIQYCEKDILGQLEYNAPRNGTAYYQLFNVTDGDMGEEPRELAFLNQEAGQLNTSLERLQVVNKTIQRDSTLTLDEDSSSYTSRELLNSAETMNHVIMIDNGGGPVHDDANFIFHDPEPSKTWTTPK